MDDQQLTGALYHIGTAYGSSAFRNPVVTNEVKITASSPVSRFTDPRRLASRTFSPVSYASPHLHESGAISTYWQVDLGEQRRLFCNYYTMRQDASEEYPRDWMLQGSQDGERWVTMHRHEDDCAIVRPGQFHSWEIDPKAAVIPLRYFMVTLTGPTCARARPVDSAERCGSHKLDRYRLCMSSIEFYGTLEY